jgi:hypothetical protein
LGSWKWNPRIQLGGARKASHLGFEQGLTLIELLVGVALTGMIGVVVVSLLFAAEASERDLARQTDAYESLRIPATMIMNDARFATYVECGLLSARFYTDAGLTGWIQYLFVGSGSGPYELHRQVFPGGVAGNDEVVATDLAKPVPSSTKFACNNAGTDIYVWFTFVRNPLPGRPNTAIRFQGTALLR